MFEIIDQYGDLVGQYKEQEGVMRTVAHIYRLPNPKAFAQYSIMHFVDDVTSKDFEALTLLGYIGENRFRFWSDALDRLSLQLRLETGADIIALQEFVEFQGLAVVYTTCDCPDTTLCTQRYTACVTDGEVKTYEAGYTRVEALAKAYLEWERQYGTSTSIRTGSDVPVQR